MFIRTERSIKEFFHFYPVVSILLIINIVLWILTHFFTESIGQIILNYGIGFNPAIYMDQEYWRLITPIFLHANIGHVLFNSFALVIFGPGLERMTGKVRFLLIYFLTGIIGNLGTYFLNPHEMTPHLGASGAIYGLLGVYLFMTMARRDLIDPQNAQIVRTIILIGVVMTFLRPNINIAAHLFGLVGGFLLASPLLRQARPFYKPTYRRALGQDEPSFDPNRWKKRAWIPKKVRDKLPWILIILLVVLYVLADY